MRQTLGTAPNPRLWVGLILLVSGIGLTGCQSQDGPNSSTSATNVGDSKSVALSAELDHIHGASVDFADGTVLTGTHSGVWRIAPDGGVTKVGGSDDDFMGFTIPRADRWLASGHPGPTSPSPNPLGLVESTDQGLTWISVSRRGETDFHALAAKGNTIVGSDGHDGLIRSQDGGETWTGASAIQVASLAFASDRLLAVTANGVEVSTDNGSTFQPVGGSPAAALLSSTGATVWVIDRAGRAWLSTDAGTSWLPRGQIGRDVSGLAAVDATRAYAISTTELVAIS